MSHRKTIRIVATLALALVAGAIQPLAASALNLSASTTANFSVFNLAYTGTGFTLGDFSTQSTASTSESAGQTDTQTNAFAFANTAGNPFSSFRYAEATGQVFDDFGVNAQATANSLNGTVSAFSNAFLIQTFQVSGAGTMTYSFDYNFFMLADLLPAGTATGTGTVLFGLGTLANQSSFADAVSFTGFDLDLTKLGSLTYDFTDGMTGILYAYAEATTLVDSPPVPEPSTFLLLAVGCAGFVIIRRRKGVATPA